MTIIVFSRDRALQLDAFLRSFWHYVFPVKSLHVLYHATTDPHASAYEEVFNRHVWATPVRQKNFKQDVLRLLSSEGCVTFFVDDQVFLRRWDVLEQPGLSLRLGLNLTYNYNSNDAPQPLPPFQVNDDGMVTWRWADGVLAWNYPLSVDGHVYDAREMQVMAHSIDFHSPNSFESQLQTYLSHFLPRHGTCYFESKVMNIPWTLVQTDWVNRNAGMSADELLALWKAGKRIDVALLYGFRNRSVHQEVPLILEERTFPLRAAR